FGSVWAKLNEVGNTPDTFFGKLGTLIGNSDSYSALLWSSLGALAIALLMTMVQRLMKLDKAIESMLVGFKTMMGTLIILILAWSLAHVTEDMHTADFLTGIMGDKITPYMIPALTFVLS
ncbi:MAG: Na+/H+ antiporter NhaC family protein, partial [Flavobacteriales bacterium]